MEAIEAQKGKMSKHGDTHTYPAALTVAGSDSGGGAGIQADLRTFSAFGIYGTSAITAVTAQNPCEVRKVVPLSPDALHAQLKAVSAKFAIGAVKTGMLHDAALIRVCAEFLEKLGVPVVVDPVMVSSSGAALLEDDAIDALRAELLPLCDWMTPNAAEAGRLLGIEIRCLDDMVVAAKECSRRWDVSCVVKGGDLADAGDKAVDVVVSRGDIYILSTPRVENPPGNCASISHGTGCTFSAAITAGIALDMKWCDILIAAKGFVFGSLSEAVNVGENLFAMYPPAQAYRNMVELKRL